MILGKSMRRPSKSKKSGRICTERLDSQGNTLEFLLRPKRDAEAAKRFFLKALGSCTDVVPHAGTIEE
jgi:transposase, IS6 family